MNVPSKMPTGFEISRYPEMKVEWKDSKEHHNIKPPIRPGEEGFDEQLNDTLVLCESAKYPGWKRDVYDVLIKHAPEGLFQGIDYSAFVHIMKSFGFDSWKQMVTFVGQDECVDLLSIISKYSKRNKLSIKKDRDFIDGEGIGLYDRYHGRLKRVMEKGRDVKYFYKQERPQVILSELLGFDSQFLGHYMHPGHWSYVAWHGAKFFESYDLAMDTWDLNKKTYLVGTHDQWIHLLAYTGSNARSGALVHLIQDNCASAALCGVKGYEKYLIKK